MVSKETFNKYFSGCSFSVLFKLFKTLRHKCREVERIQKLCDWMITPLNHDPRVTARHSNTRDVSCLSSSVERSSLPTLTLSHKASQDLD